jgi:hypothetical protein
MVAVRDLPFVNRWHERLVLQEHFHHDLIVVLAIDRDLSREATAWDKS